PAHLAQMGLPHRRLSLCPAAALVGPAAGLPPLLDPEDPAEPAALRARAKGDDAAARLHEVGNGYPLPVAPSRLPLDAALSRPPSRRPSAAADPRPAWGLTCRRAGSNRKWEIAARPVEEIAVSGVFVGRCKKLRTATGRKRDG